MESNRVSIQAPITIRNAVKKRGSNEDYTKRFLEKNGNG